MSYKPIDAINHGYHYETLAIEIPHDDFVGEWEGNHAIWIDQDATDEWYAELDNTIRQVLPVSFWREDKTDSAMGKYETVIADSHLIQIRAASYYDNWIVVIVRETPHDYEQYIHNLSGPHVNRIAKLLKAKLTQEGYQVS